MANLTLNGALSFDPIFKTLYMNQFNRARAFARRSYTFLNVNISSLALLSLNPFKANSAF